MSNEREKMALPPGKEIARYRIIELLGSWGFFLSYLAEPKAGGERLVLQELLPEELVFRSESGNIESRGERNPESFQWARDRFLMEYRALAACGHPNVMEVRDVFEANGTAYAAMRYEEGRSIKRWLEDLGRAPTEPELRAILFPALDALQTVHARGLLHLNLKSGTIRLASDGRPVLSHFAGARQAVAEHALASSAVTPGYSPPEQYDAEKTVGAWSDFYSLAAVMHRCITGQIPPEATLRLKSDPYVKLAKRFSGQYSERFLIAIDAALSPAPGARPQKASEWFRMFGRRKTPPVVAAVRAHPIATAAGIALAAAFAVYFWPRPKPNDPKEEKQELADTDKQKEEKSEKKDETENTEAQKKEAAQAEAAKAEAEKKEAERLAADKKQAEQSEAAKIEAQKKEAAQAEAAKAEAEKKEAERLAAVKKQAEQLAAAKIEEQKKETAQPEAAKAEAEKKEAERLAAVKKEAEQLATTKIEAQKREAAQAEAAKAAAEKKEAERLAAARKEAEQLATAKIEAQKREAAQAEAAKAAAEKEEAERLATARKEAEQLATAKIEAQKKEAAQAEAQKEAEKKKRETETARTNKNTPPPSTGSIYLSPMFLGVWEAKADGTRGARRLEIKPNRSFTLSGDESDSGSLGAADGIVTFYPKSTGTAVSGTYKLQGLGKIIIDGPIAKGVWTRLRIPATPAR